MLVRSLAAVEEDRLAAVGGFAGPVAIRRNLEALAISIMGGGSGASSAVRPSLARSPSLWGRRAHLGPRSCRSRGSRDRQVGVRAPVPVRAEGRGGLGGERGRKRDRAGSRCCLSAVFAGAGGLTWGGTERPA